MSDGYIIIRYYQPGDKLNCQRVIYEAIMSTVNTAFLGILTREITIQLIIITAAIMFVFIGLPPSFCLLAIPTSVLIIYVCVYLSHLVRAHGMTDLTCDILDIPRTYMSSQYTGFWVAEAFEPYFMQKNRKNMNYKILQDENIVMDERDYKRSIVGTVGVCRSNMEENTAWLRRMAVNPEFKRKGIGKALLQTTLHFSTKQGYDNLDLVTSEFHNAARELYLSKGFRLRQLYHKPVFGNLLQILMYELSYDLKLVKS